MNNANRMNRNGLIEAQAKKLGCSKAEAARHISTLLDTVTATLRKGGQVALVGFGTFETRKRAARTGYNPQTQTKIKIKATRVPAFRAGKALKASVK